MSLPAKTGTGGMSLPAKTGTGGMSLPAKTGTGGVGLPAKNKKKGKCLDSVGLDLIRLTGHSPSINQPSPWLAELDAMRNDHTRQFAKSSFLFVRPDSSDSMQRPSDRHSHSAVLIFLALISAGQDKRFIRQMIPHPSGSTLIRLTSQHQLPSF